MELHIGKDGSPFLDEMDVEVVEKTMNMKCASFFYSSAKVVDEFDIDDDVVEDATGAAQKCVNIIWEIAADIANEHDDGVASLFLNAFMGMMCLRLVEEMTVSKVVKEAEEILGGE